MGERLVPLRRADEPSGAAAYHASVHPLDSGAALRADLREYHRARVLRPPLLHHRGNLRYDVARAPYDDRVADHDAKPLELLLVVEGRALDGYPAHPHRIQDGDRRNRAGTPDLEAHVAEHSHLLLRRELVGDGPARRAGDVPHPLLKSDVVDLVDEAVNLIGKVRAELRHPRVEVMEERAASPGLGEGIDRNAPGGRQG